VFVFKGGRRYFRDYEGEEWLQGSYVVKRVGEIDHFPKAGAHAGKTLKGIYKVEGDTLTICDAEPGQERPTKFQSKEGSVWWLWGLKRVKQ
jgi:uncharacterized protein (TIGR03067 family)